MTHVEQLPDSNTIFVDTVFEESNASVSQEWVSLTELYPEGVNNPLLPETLSREQFAQGNHYECFMLSALATLVRYPDVIRNCFVTKAPRRDGRYTFQFFRGKEWVMVEIDDRIAVEEGDVLFIRSPTEHWWPLLLEKAYAKFYTSYSHLEGCTMQEVFHDLTGNPVLNIPMDPKLAKAASASVTEGAYWIDIGQKIQTGQYVCSMLTKSIDLDSLGLQKEQQYSILEIFSLTGTSAASDIVLRLHNPFEDEEYVYKGPLNSKDSTWTPKLRSRHDVDDERSFFMPLNTFLKVVLSVQMCYMSTLDSDATYFDDEWAGETAGGNPTAVTWRKNPTYLVRNNGGEPLPLTIMIKQDDQRRFTTADESTKYVQCGIIVTRYSYPHPIATKWITGNNHKPVFRSLFLNSRDVSNTVVIPPNSLCYLVPCCFSARSEAKFCMAVYRTRGVDYSKLLFMKLSVPEMDWLNPATEEFAFPVKEKERVDFYVDEETDVHILLHQTKPYVNKNGGDAMTEDYMGVYVYDDTDNKVAGVHAATNFREMSVIHHLPRSGRFALSLTCPRAKSAVTGYVRIVASSSAHVRIVDRPEDAGMFDNEDEQLDDNEEDAQVANPIDYTAVATPKCEVTEVDDGKTPFEDKRFVLDNRAVTNEPWLHIGDLYPEGKKQPLLPDRLSREQFEQGDSAECCCLIAFAALVERHPQVITNCFVTKRPRRDGRYTFRFHRYGHWVKVEIDDRIPVVDGGTVFCRSATGHWWPLLLEKAYAKFYTSYQNMEGCTPQEVFHDFTGNPVLNIPMESKLAHYAGYDVTDMSFWVELKESLASSALTALTQVDSAEAVGLEEDGAYAILDIVTPAAESGATLSDVLVKMHNAVADKEYTGPMNRSDESWTAEMRAAHDPSEAGVFYMPLTTFLETFVTVQQLYVSGVLEPCWNFNSEWGEGTNGGNPTLVTWRQNPLYVVRNTADSPLQLIVMIRQPDQRHKMHQQINRETNYIQCGIFLSESTAAERIPTYLVTGNNHRPVYRGLFANSREVSGVLTVPANSLCYLVPSAMHNEMSKFLLSYFYLRKTDERALSIERLQVPVARQLPAIEYINLQSRGKERVDFIVDVPTDVHICVRQEKVIDCGDADARAADMISMYLYNSEDSLISGSTVATTLREIGMAQKLYTPGRYVVAVTCPRGSGEVPCRVEIVALESAHVRITERPENAGDLGEVDLSFLDQDPEGVSLSDIPIDSNPICLDHLEALKMLQADLDADPREIAAVQHHFNEHVHELAKCIIGAYRKRYISEYNAELHDPLLNSDGTYMALERQHYQLRKDPRQASKVTALEEELRHVAKEIFEMAERNDLTFLDAEYAGVPTSDLELMKDRAFTKLSQSRGVLMRDPMTNARKITELEDMMHSRALEVALELHTRERNYLPAEPHGIPVSLLPLNEDDEFSALEDELRGLKRQSTRDVAAIKDCEARAKRCAEELAKKLRRDELELFMEFEPLGVPLFNLPIETDPQFHQKEVQRLYARKEDPVGNEAAIREMETQLKERALQLAREQLTALRSFLDQEPYGFPLEKLGLQFNTDYVWQEGVLQELMRNPKPDAETMRQTQETMRELVRHIAAAAAARDREFLDVEIEGRLCNTLPLDADAGFMELDVRRRRMRFRGAEPAALAALEEKMNDVAHRIAYELNVKERPNYLSSDYRGILLADLPLDEDNNFGTNEVRRQELLRDRARNARLIQEVEDALDARAMELAQARLAADRAFLDSAPAGVPLPLLHLDDDDVFADLETRRQVLKREAVRNAKPMAELERAMSAHAEERARALLVAQRALFLEKRPHGIAVTDLPLDADELFHGMEVQRLVKRENAAKNARAIQELEDALNDRASELAGRMLQEERAQLEPYPLGVALRELPLDAHADFVAQEEVLRRMSAAEDRAAVRERLNTLLHEIAAAELAKTRDFLPRELEGRRLEELPLNEDAEFRAAESEYRELRRAEEGAGAAPMSRLVELEERMQAHVYRLAKAANARERGAFLTTEYRHVPLQSLPLDEDDEFRQLEAERARLRREPERNAKEVALVESALQARAEELALETIRADRVFLEEEPHGVAVKYLPLDKDAAFQALEAERTALRAVPPALSSTSQATRIAALEAEMNERAATLAKEMRQELRERVLPSQLNGIALDALPLDGDVPFTGLEAAYIQASGDGDSERAQDLEDAMVKRATDVAHKVHAEVRALVGMPLGYSAEDLNLEENEAYVQKETELLRMRNEPPRPSTDRALAEAEEALRALAEEAATTKAAKERFFLDPEPEGQPLAQLPLNQDPTYRRLEEQYHRTSKDPYADADFLRDLEQMMNQRAHDLARQRNAQERVKFLDLTPRNVPLSELPLDTDEIFTALEAKRAKLCQQPAHNQLAISQIEEELNARSDELAHQALKNDRMFLEDEPEHVALRQIDVDGDAVFVKLEQQRALLKAGNPAKKAPAISALETQMAERLRVLAREVKQNTRRGLSQAPQNIPLSDLTAYLDEDKHFHSLEEMYRDAVQREGGGGGGGEGGDSGAARQQLLEQMNERARDIADAVHAMERRALPSAPEGVPLDALPLNEDRVFSALENEARTLRSEHNGERRNAGRLAQIQQELTERLTQLAHESRKGYCDATVEGLPLEMLALGQDERFTAAEAELRRLRALGSQAHKEAIGNLEYELNHMAHQRARAMLQSERDTYLDERPAGVERAALPLNRDDAFRALEAQRMRLKAEDPLRHRRAVTELEAKLNARAAELGQALKAEELAALEPEPLGLTYDLIQPYEDPAFADLAERLRRLQQVAASTGEGGGTSAAALASEQQAAKRNAPLVAEVRAAMNARVTALAEAMLHGSGDFLEPVAEGVPVRHLALDADPTFHKLAVERAKLTARDAARNRRRIESIEDQMNARARELATQKKAAELALVPATPCGIPVELLDPHADRLFASYVEQVRERTTAAAATAAGNESSLHTTNEAEAAAAAAEEEEEMARLVAAMKDRVEALAQEKLTEDRANYLPADQPPRDVPLDLLPLHTDPTLHALEVERAVAKAREPRRGALRLPEIDARIRDRVAQLAEEQRQRDLAALDPHPHGIPLTLLDPHRDALFQRLVDTHRALGRDPDADPALLVEVEQQMNERVYELAAELLEGDRGYMDPEPQGVPLRELPVGTDTTLHSMEVERAICRLTDGRRNPRKLAELEERINNRLHELAREQLRADVEGVDAAPRGIPLELLRPHHDPAFANAVSRAREARKAAAAASSSGGADSAEVQAAVAELNAAARALADRALDRGYLDAMPVSGVPLEILPLDTDPTFHALEVERAKLLLGKDRLKHGRRVAELESQLTARVAELARAQWEDDLSGCDAAPEGIALELLRPTEDPTFAAMIPLLRELKKDRETNANAIFDLENRMNNRAYDLADALLEGDRSYLERKPRGVALAHLPLMDDFEFCKMEVQRATLVAQDARRHQRAIQALEVQLRHRADELAEERRQRELGMFAEKYDGVEVAALCPHDDAEFAGLMESLREQEAAVASGGGASPSSEAAAAMEQLRDDMDRRLHELAKERTEGDLWFVDATPEGVTLAELPLATDEAFRSAQEERRRLKTSGPRRNLAQIQALEEQMNLRAHELAAELKSHDFDGIDAAPCGIPVKLLRPREDAAVARMVQELRRARRGAAASGRESARVTELTAQLAERLRGCAQEALTSRRGDYLDAAPEGVAREYLPLDTDRIFAALEVERAKLVLDDPVRHARAIEELQERLNQRAHELAEDVLMEEWGVASTPAGGSSAPASLTSVGAVVPELPMAVVRPHEDAEFAALAQQRRALLPHDESSPRRGGGGGASKQLREVEQAMRTRWAALMRQTIEGDRGDYLDAVTEDVATDSLPLSQDATFHALEVKRAECRAMEALAQQSGSGGADATTNTNRGAALQGAGATPSAVYKAKMAEWESRLRDRAVALARAQKEEDLRDVAEGLPVPAVLLALHRHEPFRALLPMLRQLKANPNRANQVKQKALQEKMRGMAQALAADYVARDRAQLLESALPAGLPLTALPLDTDGTFASLEQERYELRQRQAAASSSSSSSSSTSSAATAAKCDEALAELESALRDRAVALVAEQRRGDRASLLPATIDAVATSALPLDTDRTFGELEVRRAVLKAQAAAGKADYAALTAVEEQMLTRARELAAEQRSEDLCGIPTAPHDIPIALLQPHRHEPFNQLAREMRAAVAQNRHRGEAAAALQQQMVDVVEQLAHRALAGSRGDYVDANYHGVTMEELPLDGDALFHALEVERAQLVLQDSVGSPSEAGGAGRVTSGKHALRIRELEEQLRERGHVLADAVLESDLVGLDAAPRGIPLRVLHPHRDATFAALAADRRRGGEAHATNRQLDQSETAADSEFADYYGDFYGDGQAEEAGAVDSVTGLLNDRLDAMARDMLQRHRDVYLPPLVEGLPLSTLPLDTDAEFHAMEVERVVLAEEGAVGGGGGGAAATARALAGLDERLQARARQLAMTALAGDRASYLEAMPEAGVPLSALPLDTDVTFHALEVERAKCRATTPTSGRVAELESQLRARAQTLAQQQRRADLEGVDAAPCGIALELLQPHRDAEFAAMLPELRRLKQSGDRGEVAQIRECQARLSRRAGELAAAQVARERAFLDPAPQGIPLDRLALDEDKSFVQLEKQARRLLASGGGAGAGANNNNLSEVRAAMQNRVHELALALIQGDRGFLDPEPEGIPLADLPLGEDADFAQWESERARLKAEAASPSTAEAMAALEGRLNERAHELAQATKESDRAFLPSVILDLPRALLPLDTDPSFVKMEQQLRRLRKDAMRNRPAMENLQDMMQERATELAEALLVGERDRYVGAQVDGVARADLPLDEDKPFHALEVRRATAVAERRRRRRRREGGGVTAAHMDALAENDEEGDEELVETETALRTRAEELAAAMRREEGLFLGESLCGIPVAALPLRSDANYTRMEEYRRKLRKDPRRNAATIQDTQEKMLERARVLAQAMAAEDLTHLPETSYRGLGRADLRLHENANFRRAADRRRSGALSPEEESEAVAEMDRIARSVADAMVESERAFLPREVEGMDLHDLPLDEDKEFVALETERRRRMRDGSRAAAARRQKEGMAELESRMQDRVHALARERRTALRDFLEPALEGVPLAQLALDADPEFAEMERARCALLRRGGAAAGNDQMARKTAELERRMKDRVHELARRELAKDRAFLDKEPHGVPLAMLDLANDSVFAEMAAQRRALKTATSSRHRADPAAVRALEARMNDRVYDLAEALLQRHRDYLHPEPLGVPLADLPLNRDAIFRDMEAALMRAREPHTGGESTTEAASVAADCVAQLQLDLNARAEEVARDVLRRERAGQDQEPLGVALEELFDTMNRDAVLNPLERKRRDLKRGGGGAEAAANLMRVEADIASRVNELAADFLQAERQPLDADPEGVPLARLALSQDRPFHELERRLRRLKKQPAKNHDEMEEVLHAMNDRAYELAREYLAQERRYLPAEPLGVALARLPLNTDEEFAAMERERRALRARDARGNAAAVTELEKKLQARALVLAQAVLDRDRAFLDPAPEGILLKDLPLNKDKPFREMERQLQELRRRDPRANATAIASLEADMNDRVHTLALRQLADDRAFLNPEPLGVPLADLDLDADADFHAGELERRALRRRQQQQHGGARSGSAEEKAAAQERLASLEEELNRRARAVAEAFLAQERTYLDPCPGGVPLAELPLNEDPTFRGLERDRRRLGKDATAHAAAMAQLERRLNERACELAKEKKGYQDEVFHAANASVVESGSGGGVASLSSSSSASAGTPGSWRRLRELYPEGLLDPLTPDTTLPSDVASAPGDMSFLAPFIAALARHTPLITRLFPDTPAHPGNHQPYRVTFFNPDSTPATVEVDDRIPCDGVTGEPMFTQAPTRMYYPLLLEKAYAKFIGGYANYGNCNAHVALRDLTGRPVLHISLEDSKHAAAMNMRDFNRVEFWREVRANLVRGDVYVCVARDGTPDGFHSQCSYAMLDIIETKPNSTDLDDVVVKLHNAYRDEPAYHGPLAAGDARWTAELRRSCGYEEEQEDGDEEGEREGNGHASSARGGEAGVIYTPVSTFLRNFGCLQRCHINCGDRLSAAGEWNAFTAGGTSKFTSFRANPVYLVENRSGHEATILAEVRHRAPLSVDEGNFKHYPYTGMALLQPISAKLPPTPLITNGTHRFLQKGMMLDSREVCAEMKLPAHTTCYLVPYTKDRGTYGQFDLSIYPDLEKVTLTPLRHAGLTLSPLRQDVTVTPGNDTEGARLDFTVSQACDVHILLHQLRVEDASRLRKSNAVGEDNLAMSAYNEYGIRVGSTGDTSNAREHALVFKAPQGGLYSVVVNSYSSSSSYASAPTGSRVRMEIYTPAAIQAALVPVPADARPLGLQSNSRFPTASRGATAPGMSRHASRERARSQDLSNGGAARTESLPPMKGRASSTRRSNNGSAPQSAMNGSRITRGRR